MTGCSVFKKSGTTVASDNANVKTTAVSGQQPESSYDESQIAPLMGSWSVTAING